MSERMSFDGYLVFLDGEASKGALATLDGAESCAVTSTMVRIDDRVAWIRGVAWASLGMWDPTYAVLQGIARRALAGSVHATVEVDGQTEEWTVEAFATHDEALRERLLEPLWRDRSAATDAPATPGGTCWLSLGLDAFLPASGEDERDQALCRDELLFTITDDYMPGPEYTVYDIAPPGVSLASESGTVDREVLLMASKGIGGMMPEPGAAHRGEATARIRQRVHDAGPRHVEIPLSPEQLGISTPALLVPDPYPSRVLRFTNLPPFDATHPLQGVTIGGAGAVLDHLRRESRGMAIDQACRLLELTMIEGVVVAMHSESKRTVRTS